MNNQNFFADFLNRLFSAKPKFFTYIQGAAAVLFAFSWLVGALQDAHIALPAIVVALNTVAVKVAAVVAMVIAQLPKKDINTKP